MSARRGGRILSSRLFLSRAGVDSKTLEIESIKMGRVSPKGNPPALLEDSRSLTTPGVVESLAIVNRSKFTKGDSNERIRDSETYDMGMQISCGFIPKYRRKGIYGQLRKVLGSVFRDLAGQKESEVLEGHLMVDHVHMLLAIPPKYAVLQVMGFIKGKSAIYIARVYGGRR